MRKLMMRLHNAWVDYRRWREVIRLQMRQMMHHQGWITERMMQWGYEVWKDPDCKRCRGTGEITLHWKGKRGGLPMPCDCAVAVYVSVWKRMARWIKFRWMMRGI